MKGEQTRVGVGQLERMASIGCTEQEIAYLCSVSYATVKNLLASSDVHRHAFERGHAKMCHSLRQAQYNSAINKGNVTAQIWLGKQYLGQREPGPLPLEKNEFGQYTEEELMGLIVESILEKADTMPEEAKQKILSRLTPKCKVSLQIEQPKNEEG